MGITDCYKLNYVNDIIAYSLVLINIVLLLSTISLASG